ncbi:MAG: transcription termination/antitermination protein NusA [Clostridiales bacterium]|jgi:N utilization substance protein A|nr:transcription termination/antitermination protein NusA [Clostridiales bacterium]
MNAEFFKAIEQIEKEKGIPQTYMLDKVGQALITAYRRDHSGISDNVIVEPDLKKKEIRMYVNKEVVEDVTNPETQIALSEARETSQKCELGDIISIQVSTKNFGRIAAQTAKQVIIQGIREAERGLIYQEFTSREHEVLTAQVVRLDPRSGGASLIISGGNERAETFLSAKEQVPGEQLREGDLIKIYVVDVKKNDKGPQVLISRTHPGLVRRLFEIEVPEIHDGTVEVKSIAREAGSRTKIAVYSHDENVDPIGACVGPRGNRVASIVEELRGEKIDIVKYSENIEEYIAAALAPADVLEVSINENERTCRVVVADDQLSLAIGKEGQNARLAAKLTGFKIDIKPASQAVYETDTGEDAAEEQGAAAE